MYGSSLAFPCHHWHLLVTPWVSLIGPFIISQHHLVIPNHLYPSHSLGHAHPSSRLSHASSPQSTFNTPTTNSHKVLLLIPLHLPCNTCFEFCATLLWVSYAFRYFFLFEHYATLHFDLYALHYFLLRVLRNLLFLTMQPSIWFLCNLLFPSLGFYATRHSHYTTIWVVCNSLLPSFGFYSTYYFFLWVLCNPPFEFYATRQFLLWVFTQPFVWVLCNSLFLSGVFMQPDISSCGYYVTLCLSSMQLVISFYGFLCNPVSLLVGTM